VAAVTREVNATPRPRRYAAAVERIARHLQERYPEVRLLSDKEVNAHGLTALIHGELRSNGEEGNGVK